MGKVRVGLPFLNVKVSWFILILMAISAWNLLFYVTVMPEGESKGDEDAASSDKTIRAPTSLAHADASFLPQSWVTLDNAVEKEPLFGPYKKLQALRSQSWRIKKYGKVCIVSDAFMGPTVSSGHGTALTTLAEILAMNGFDVTLLYTRGDMVQSASSQYWTDYYHKLGIRFVPLPWTLNYDVSPDVAVAHKTFMWLRSQDKFDVIHFADTRGSAFFCTNAKEQGLDFLQTILVVHLHCPHMWYKINSLKLLDNVNDLIIDHLEQQSALKADYLISPSHYMLTWLHMNGWNLPEDKLFVQGNLTPRWLMKHTNAEEVETMQITEFVYYAKVELKKGIVLFCDALDQLSKKKTAGFTVSFLGLFPNDADEFLTLPGNINARVEEYIKHRSVKWAFEWKILKDVGPESRMEYLKSGRRLAVMPSIMENSPFGIMECLVAGVPFIATRVGGVEELIEPSDRERLLVEPSAKEIAKRLGNILVKGLKPGSNEAISSGEESWLIWHHILRHEADAFDVSNMHYSTPLVSVCVVTYNNPGLLKQTLASIERQDYAHYEVIVVDDGSTLEEANLLLEELRQKFAPKGWKVLQQANRGPGAARNFAAQEAQGDFLFFMDDDNIAKRDEITTFVNVAEYTQSDVLTCVNDYFHGDKEPTDGQQPTGRWVPIGAAKTVGMFQNMYGDTNAMIRRSVFEFVGGFPDDYGYALEDWELFSKAVLAGFKLRTIPLPLYWYRLRLTSHSRTTAKHSNNVRTIRPYLDTIPTSLHHLVLFAQGMKESHDKNGQFLEIEKHTAFELQKVVKAMSSSLQTLCQEGKIYQKANNLLTNPSFSYSGDGDHPTMGWKQFGEGYLHDSSGGRVQVERGNGYSAYDTFGIKMASTDWRRTYGAVQEIALNQNHPEAVVISGWSKADQVSGNIDGGYAIYVDIVFTDGSVKWGYTIPFDVGTHSWQFRAGVIDPDLPIHGLILYTMFRGHTGTVWFDHLSVTFLRDGLCDYTQLVLEGVGT